MWNLKKKRIQINELTDETEIDSQTQKTNCWGEGWTGGLGLAYEHCGLWNDWPMGTCCIVQGTLINILIIDVGEESERDWRCVHV